MKKISGMDVLLWSMRLLVGGVLVYAGFLKAVAPTAEFTAAIDAYRLVPYHVASIAAFVVPWVELLTGTYLIFGFMLRATAIVAGVLFSVFLIALGSTLARGMDLASCGCFGAETLRPKQTIGVDILLLGLSVMIVMLSRAPRPGTVDRWIEMI
jgi:uncharacterized membrane protein YphA (DoxX/SURF4 family)